MYNFHARMNSQISSKVVKLTITNHDCTEILVNGHLSPTPKSFSIDQYLFRWQKLDHWKILSEFKTSMRWRRNVEVK